MRLYYKSIFKITIAQLLLTFMVFSVFTSLWYYYSKQDFVSNLKRAQKEKAEIIQRTFQRFIDHKKNRVFFYSENHFLKDFMKLNSTDARLNLFNYLIKNLNDDNVFAIRILDFSGKEIFKVKYNKGKAELVDNSKLQDKSHRDYFKRASKLVQGDIYISDYDYNMEYGKIEEPYRPTLRVMAAIYIDGNKKGYLIINYSQKSFNDALLDIKGISHYTFYIFNKKFHLLNTVSGNNFKLNASMCSKRLLNDICNPEVGSYFKLNGSIYYKQELNFKSKNSLTDLSLLVVVQEKASFINAFQHQLLLKIVVSSAIVYCLLNLLLLLLIYAFIKTNKNAVLVSHSFKLFEFYDNGMVIANEDWKIEYANPAFTHMFNISYEECIGKSLQSFRSKRYEPEFYEKIWETVDSKKIWEGNISETEPKGKKIVREVKIEKVIGKNRRAQIFATFKDVSRLHEELDMIRRESALDLNTGLPNEKLLNREIRRRAEKFKQNRNLFAYTLIKLSSLEEINYTYGYEEGDRIISEFAERLKLTFSKEDYYLAKLSDNNFIILSDFTDCDSHSSVISAKLNKLEARAFSVAGNDLFVKLHVGVSVYPTNGNNNKKLFSTASLATGHTSPVPGSINYYSDELAAEIKEKAFIANALNSSDVFQEFSIEFQPKVDSRTKDVVGAEALIRWENRALGKVPTDQFIAVAEDTGSIIEITKWVIGELCHIVATWKKMGIINIPISFNATPHDLISPGFVQFIQNKVTENRISFSDIILEVTETTFSSNHHIIIDRLDSLRKLGVRILIDDFGTGYSSLNYLDKFNIDGIKIDREFIQGFPKYNNGSMAKIISSIADSINLSKIVEGVETKEQVEFLSSINCFIIQGFFYSRPLSISVFEKVLKIHSNNSNQPNLPGL